jgi:hypothetical protein
MSEKPDTCVSRLEAWFASECNGDWEHTYGIKLETVDNPVWMFTVEIEDTPLSGRPFTTIAERASDSDWLHCAVTDNVFRGSGGIGSLERILMIFLEWAEESRLQNLLLIPEKRHAAGIAQAHLAVRVANAFQARRIAEGASLREVLDAIERIGQIATNKRLTSVLLDYEIDILSAVPIETVDYPAFRMKRWPQITQLVEERQRKYQQQRARRGKPK